MIDEKLVEYIKVASSRGMPLEKIRANLYASGWTELEVMQAEKIVLVQPTAPRAVSPLIVNTQKSPATKPIPFTAIAAVVIVLVIASAVGYFVFVNKNSLFSSDSSFESNADLEENSVIASAVPTASIKPTTTPSPTINPSATLVASLGLLECKNDLDCFIEASKTCSLSNVTHSYSFLGTPLSSYYEIKGLDEGNCKFFFETAGTKRTCWLTTPVLTAMLTRWKMGSFSTSDWDGITCE